MAGMRRARVNRSFVVEGSTDRVVLFSWSADPEPRQRNVVRVDRHGREIWRADLPTKAASDCFVSLEREGDGFVARTYSEWVVRLDVEGRPHQTSRGNCAM